MVQAHMIIQDVEMMNKDPGSITSELKAVHEDVRLIPAEIIVVSDWVRMKCRYGCDNYGKRLGWLLAS